MTVGAHSTFAASSAGDGALPAARLDSSAGLGWRNILAIRYAEQSSTDVFDTMAWPNLLLVHVESGHYRIESRRRGVLNRSVFHPGSLGMRTAGQYAALRWSSIGTEPLRSVHIHLEQRLIDETFDSLQVRPTMRFVDGFDITDPLLVASSRAVADALTRHAPALYADSLAQAMAAHLVSGQAIASSPAVGMGASTLTEVIEFMRSQLHRDLSLDDLAATAHLSRFHFLRQFARATGTTPYRYLAKLRMERAAVLLRSGPASIAVIAQRCGYASPSQFAQAFRRHYGMSPSRYRSG